MKSTEEIFEKASQLHLSGNIQEAQNLYLELIKIDKKNNKLFFLLGTTFLQQKKYDQSINYLNNSINLDPTFPNPYNNLGIALTETTNYLEAKKNYDKAISLNKNYIDAYLNRGISLNKLNRYEEAIQDFKIVLKANPNNSKAYNNLGNIYKNLENYEKSILFYDKAISIDSNFLEALGNKSSVLHIQKKYQESLIYLNKIYKINEDFKGLVENIILDKMHIFDWNDLNNYTDKVRKQFLDGKTFDPLFMHYLFDEPNLHKSNSEKFIKERVKYISRKNNLFKSHGNNKIKIGYFSADYHNHPVLHIMSDIFKSHDKTKFELYGFSFGPEKKENIWREDIKSCFKEFHLVNKLSDEEIKILASNLKIDIAIDLTGLTKNGRPSLFFKRVAPIQITYLGYPGTSGNKEIDYIIADKEVIPKNAKKYYTEEVIYLPDTYIPSSNDVLLDNSNYKFSRKDHNLPNDKIVFCAFHNPLKINPELFDIWCNILKKVDQSVLWLKIGEEISKKNLISEAIKRNIDSSRIIFAERMDDINKHINRLKLADIFLDTYPYNSHSTIYDYIRAKLPMIILKGEAFSSRVGASIYSSIKMEKLVAKNKIQYEKLAVELGNNKSKLNKIKNELKINSEKFKIFDNIKITKDLEKIYFKLIKGN